jgi:ribonuclease HI
MGIGEIVRSMVKIVQINVGKRRLAGGELHNLISKEKIEIALIQEPYTGNDKQIKRLPDGVTHYNAKNDEIPRSCIWVSRNLNNKSKCIQLKEYSDCDTTVIRLNITLEGGGVKNIIICSAYCPNDNVNRGKVINDKLNSLVSKCKDENIELIIGCDANSHHEIWGSKKECPRGKKLLDYITSNNLHILNRGNEPTWRQNDKKDVIDLTLSTVNIGRRIINWKVNTGESFSDHKYIQMEIKTDKLEPEKFRGKKNTNWVGYRETITRLLSRPMRDIVDSRTLDKEASRLTEAILDAYKANSRLTVNSKKCQLKWQSSKLLEQRKKLRKLHNTAHRSKNVNLWRLYKNELNIYKADCKKAMSESWKNEMNEIESISEVARLQKILEKKSTARTGTLKKDDGSYTKDVEENNKILLETHFPQCEVMEGNEEYDNVLPDESNMNDANANYINESISIEKINWAIDSFSPYKAAGEDGIFPALLQKAKDLIGENLQTLFGKSLELGYIPKCWRGTMVAFIPKPGKPDYDLAKAYRPISLMSFILKTLEKLIDRNIRLNELKENDIHRKQFAYQEGKSTEDALHDLVTKLDESILAKKVSIAVFIDIEGAFDNTDFEIIENAARRMNINGVAVKWVKAMLKSREVKSNIEGSTIRIKPTRGCPQGGCLSPLLWCMVVNSLIIELENMGCHVTAYADDLALVISCYRAEEACDEMNKILKQVESWCRRNGLNVNPSKTTIMRITRLRAEDKIKMKDVMLSGEKLKMADDFKYLGIYIDSKLSMKKHIDETTTKSLRSLWAAKAMVSRTWGLSPKIAMWLYKQVILPRITYGSIVWWHRAKLKTYAKKLNSVQRLATLMVTGAMKSTPTATLNLMLDLSPVELAVEIRAIETYSRMKLNNNWIDGHAGQGHGSLCQVGSFDQTTDKCIRNWNFNRNFKTVIGNRDNWHTFMDDINDPLIWFTDGSKREDRVACGVYCQQTNLRKSLRLSDYGTVMQAETIGLMTAVELMIANDTEDRNIVILTDSQALIKALDKNTVTSKTTIECIEKLKLLASNNIGITIGWVPGHSDIEGNEIADELAEDGLDHELIDKELHRPESSKAAAIKEYEEISRRRIWTDKEGLEHSKLMINCHRKERFSRLLELNRRNLRVIIGIISGHCCLKKFLYRIGKVGDNMCRFCEGYEEDMKHVLTECLELRETRRRTLGSEFPDNRELKSIEIKKLLKFAKETGIFETFFKEN